jgi:DNA-binding transcriptional MerR regulator
MSRPSTIDKLEGELRGEINRLRVDKGFTIEQIVEYLKAMNVTVSSSAIGRHVKKLAEVTARILEARAIAEGVAPTLAGKDDGELLNLNVELLHAGVMRIQSATDDNGDDVQLKPSEAMAIGKALEAASKAQKINADRVLKIRKEAAEKAVTAAVSEIKKAVPGLTADKVDAMRKAISERVLGT